MPESDKQKQTRAHREPTRQEVLTVGTRITSLIQGSDADKGTKLRTYLKKIERLRVQLSTFDGAWYNAADANLTSDEYQAEYRDIQKHQDELDYWQTAIEDHLEATGEASLHDAKSRLSELQSQAAGGGEGSAEVTVLLERLVAVQEQQAQTLPTIKMRRFNGDVTQFIAFWEEFSTAVHEKAHLKDIQRFKYLRDHLDGEAAKALQGISPTGENYPKAIRYLFKRYGNLETIVMGVFTTMIGLSKVHKVSDQPHLRDLLDKINNCIMTLDTMKLDSKYYASVLYPVLLRLLPDQLMYRYLGSIEDTQAIDDIDPDTPLPSFVATDNLPQRLSSRFDELRTFLAKEVATREQQARICALPGGGDNKHRNNGPGSGGGGGNAHNSATLLQHGGRAQQPNKDDNKKDSAKPPRKHNICVICNVAHKFGQCLEKLSMDQRVAKVDAAGCCRKCLRKGHKTDSCATKVCCYGCRGDHMRVMCAAKAAGLYVGTNDSLLPTGHCMLQGVAREENVRFILDSGSQRTYITTRLADLLKLKHEGHEWLYVHVFGAQEGKLDKFPVVSFNALSRSGDKVCFRALVTPNICNKILPSIPGDIRELVDVDLAENVEGPTELSLLLNAADMARVARGAIRSIGDSLFLMPTLFGNVVISSTMPSANPVNMISMPISLEDFWKLEHIGIQQEELAESKPDFQKVVEDFDRSIEQDDASGRYSCQLNIDDRKLAQLGDNMGVARKQAQSLMKKLRKEPALREAYVEEMNVFLEKGFAEPMPEGEVPTYVLPHFAVVNPSKQSYKVRPVFNASAHAKGQLSLNDCILDVPNLLPTSVEVLLKFRSHKVGLAGDITKAYLMVGVHEQFRNSLCFLWALDDDLRELQLFRMTANTFGVKDAQFNVISVIRRHAEAYSEAYPEASKALSEHLYLDDLLSGADSLEDALLLKQQVSTVLKAADMEMKKWRVSQSEEVCQAGGKPLAVPKGTDKVLGIVWKEDLDILSFTGSGLLDFIRSAPPTKRTLMGAVARLYDPVGFVSPFTMKAKLILQDAHIQKLAMDAPLPADLLKQWVKWCDEIQYLEDFVIPRNYTAGLGGAITQELHAFADASDRAYAAVVYLKSVDEAGKVSIALVASKARLTPIKSLEQLTIPRKELIAALCAARLIEYVASRLGLEGVGKFLWSDSMTVLHWIHGAAPEKHGVFIKNRLTEILQLSKPEQWAHVEGVNNPADLPSRGCDMKKLSSAELWLQGPEFLAGKEPYPRFVADPTQGVTLTLSTAPPVFDVHKFSSLTKAVRTFATVLRCVRRFRHLASIAREGSQGRLYDTDLPTESLKSLGLQVGEVSNAKRLLIQQSQERCFGEAIAQIRDEQICDDSRIASFQPFIGQDGLLRVNGRLENMDEPYEVRHPVILTDDHLTRLIIQDVHVKGVRHLRTNVVLTNLRQTFWVLKSRQLVKTIIHHCTPCTRERATPGGAIEAPLPASRVDGFTTPFKHVGADYLGPFAVLMDKKSVKVWVALFTCSVTRAVHLEVVEDLTGKACVDAIKRFIACRGLPSTMTTDNGLNFVRTERAFRSLWVAIKSSDVQTYFGKKGIEWNFNVPKAAWWGGQFERLIRIVKDCVKRSVKEQVLPLFEFMTFMKEVEAIINNRPLTTIPSSPSDPVPLTPAHFVASRLPITLPPGQVSAGGQRGDMLVRMWRTREQALNRFWRRWRNEYLLHLRSGHARKMDKNAPLEEGDVVIIQQDNSPRHLWRLGRISKVIMGRDGIPRSCEVQTAKGPLRRAVQHLYKIL